MAGAFALNKHVTDIANGAGLSRAADPQGFCSKTWELFFDLEQAPEQLLSLAEANLMSAIGQPQACETKSPVVASTETAAPQEAEAAVK